MAYQVDRFNGQFLVSVDDGTIDTTTDLRFVGKNYAGYGELQNENFLHLLENFANTTPPPRAIVGQIWYDSGAKKLKYFDGSRFKVSGGAEIGPNPPSGLAVGEFWWDTEAKQLYAWSGTDFLLVGPEASPELGQSIVSPNVVRDSENNPNTIIQAITGGKTVAIFSQTEFTLDSELNPIIGFTRIKKGITLSDTLSSGVSINDYIFWGTSSNTLKLGGVDAVNYLRKDDTVFEQETKFQDPGFTVGNKNDLRVRIEGDDTVIENRLGNDIVIKIDSSPIAVFSKTAVAPNVLGINLGTVLARWNNIYSNNLFGELTGNVIGNVTGSIKGNVEATDTTVLVNAETKEIGTADIVLRGNLIGSVEGNLTGTATNSNRLAELEPSVLVPTTTDKTSVVLRDPSGNISGINFLGTSIRSDRTRIDNDATDPIWNPAAVSTQYRTAKITKSAYSIVARDAAGDVFAEKFRGTATSAQYADLAEKYLSDQNYEVGTVVVVGGEAEVTASSEGQRAIGVVSDSPAFMMNSELKDGIYIALKGRVPVKVLGKVKKGDRLVAADNGCAKIVLVNNQNVFAIALESSDLIDIKNIEAVIL